jgi:hypothetical protein
LKAPVSTLGNWNVISWFQAFAFSKCNLYRYTEEKLAAVAAASLLCNLPIGAWREHTRKFSFEWWVALHASIPFVISLRKAVVGLYKLNPVDL